MRKLTTRQARQLARMRKTHGAGSGRPRDLRRCPCGVMTAHRAGRRKHVCNV